MTATDRVWEVISRYDIEMYEAKELIVEEWFLEELKKDQKYFYELEGKDVGDVSDKEISEVFALPLKVVAGEVQEGFKVVKEDF